jgi:plasmid stability protein
VELTDDLDARLRQEAARRQTTVSQLTREAIETALGGAGRRRFGAAKAGGSGQTDISERIEQILSCQVAR